MWSACDMSSKSEGEDGLSKYIRRTDGIFFAVLQHVFRLA